MCRSFIPDEICYDIRKIMDTSFVSYTCDGHYIYGSISVGYGEHTC